MNTEPVTEFLRQLGAASAQASALGLVVWLSCRGLGRHLAPRWRCGLWSLVILRLCWPFNIPSPVSLFNVWMITRQISPSDWLPTYLPEELSNVAESWVHRSFVVWLWLAVAGILAIRLGVIWFWSVRVRRLALPIHSEVVLDMLDQCRKLAGVSFTVPLRESGQIDSPCLIGLMRPCLLVPAGLMEELSGNEIRLVLLHELAHLRRRDIAVNWVLSAVEIFHWYNPLVWLVSRELRAAREEACDACALAMTPGANRSYGEMLLKLLERLESNSHRGFTGSLCSTSAMGDASESTPYLEHRLRAILRFRPGVRTWIVGGCTWMALACIGLTEADPPTQSDGPDAGIALVDTFRMMQREIRTLGEAEPTADSKP